MKQRGAWGVVVAMSMLLTGAAETPDSKPKPPATAAAATVDLKNLQGTWRVVRAENKGEDVKDRLGYEQFTVQGSTMRVTRNGEERTSVFEIDPTRDPKWVNFTTPQGKQIQGIYELKGDTWRTISRGGGRPATFEDEGCVLFVYQRANAAAATKPAATKPVK